jgi:hypothetical protein
MVDYDHYVRAGIHTRVDASCAAPQADKIVNVELHWEYSLGIVFV